MWKMNIATLDDEQYLGSLRVNITQWKSQGEKELSDKRLAWDWVKYTCTHIHTQFFVDKSVQGGKVQRGYHYVKHQPVKRLNHLQMSLKRQHILLSHFKTLSVGPVWDSNPRPSIPHSSLALYQLS